MVDPIILEVVGNALLSVAEEMGMVLIRSSYSTNIKERRDCSTAIFDIDGQTIVQAEHIPIHMGSMLGIVKNILDKYSIESIHEGDMFLANDPYTGGGTHLPDITIAAPVFYENRLVAFVANIAHHSDVGGKVAGSISGDCQNIFQEGLRLPPVRVMNRWQVEQEIIDIILLNCRTPEERIGDLRAQLAANKTGFQRMLAIYHRYGYKTVSESLQEWMYFAEQKFRSGIRDIPDGAYEFEDFMDDDGVGGGAVPIRIKITIQGDRIHLDFAGTGSQVEGGINVVYRALQATVLYALKSIIDPTIPANGGYYRAVEISAPEGSIVNALPPAAVAGRTDTCQRIVDVVFGAMSKAAPEKVIAGCHSTVTAVLFSGIHPETKQTYVYIESLGGGFGARPKKDGIDGVQVHITNSSNLPVESLEREYPLIVERYELIPDSGGAGKYRGGLGLRRDIRILDHVSTFASHGDRQKFPPWGLLGGQPGKVGKFVINPGTTKERVLPSGKNSDIILKPDDILSVQTPGSGGYGPPGERDKDLILIDQISSKVSSA